MFINVSKCLQTAKSNDWAKILKANRASIISADPNYI